MVAEGHLDPGGLYWDSLARATWPVRRQRLVALWL